jgi:hypothetical protein
MAALEPEERVESDDTPLEDDTPLNTLIAEAYNQDEVVKDIIAAKNCGVRHLPRYIQAMGLRLAKPMGDLTVQENRL